jgi:hypothetical protein
MDWKSNNISLCEQEKQRVWKEQISAMSTIPEWGEPIVEPWFAYDSIPSP